MTANDRDDAAERVLCGQLWRRKDEDDTTPSWAVAVIMDGRVGLRQRKGKRLRMLTMTDLRLNWRRVPA